MAALVVSIRKSAQKTLEAYKKHALKKKERYALVRVLDQQYHERIDEREVVHAYGFVAIKLLMQEFFFDW